MVFWILPPQKELARVLNQPSLRHAYFRNNAYLKVSQFGSRFIMFIFEPCLFSNGRLLLREYGMHGLFSREYGIWLGTQ